MPSYDFTQLSDFDFELICGSLLGKQWGVQLETFKSGRDGGIDLRYARADGPGETIVQCKHYVRSGFSALLSHLKLKEAPKLQALSPKRYVIATSVGLTPGNKEAIRSALAPYIANTSDIYGQGDLNQLLADYPEVEQSNLKLWLTSKPILDRVLHNAEICRTTFSIQKIISKLPRYVQNDCFPRAAAILADHNVVVISGVPGIGKTTLAEMILYEHLSQGYNPVVITSDLREGRSLYNEQQKQIFYYDDFLGQTFLRDNQGFLLKKRRRISD